MTQQKTFRTALNGFNREDVVAYIEYLNSVHAAEINQLRSELEFYRNRQPEVVTVTEPAVVDYSEKDAVIEQQAARIRELFDRCKELEDRASTAEEAKSHAEEKLQAVLTQQSTLQARAGEELEAYRRAERTERIAKERAELVYHQINGVLAEASQKVEGVATEIGGMADSVMSQLTQLQVAVANSKKALNEAASTMYAIRPNN